MICATQPRRRACAPPEVAISTPFGASMLGAPAAEVAMTNVPHRARTYDTSIFR